MRMLEWGQSNHLTGTSRECAGGDHIAVAVHQGNRRVKGGSAQAYTMIGSTNLPHAMTRLLRNLSLFLIVFALGSTAAHAQSAATLNKRGLDAETREDWDAAYTAFRQAWLKKPKDLRYKTRMESVMVSAAALHVDHGRVLRQQNDDQGALREFMRALEIDPSDQTAQQEIQITQRKDGAGQPPPSSNPPAQGGAPTAANPITATERDLADLGSPILLKPVTDKISNLHLVEDVKVIYQAIGKLAGLNVLFDPDYTSKRIPVDLTNVSVFDALRIVGTISGTFWKPVTANTIFVAQNTRNKHQDLDNMAVQTFYLTNVATQADANELQTALRQLLDPSTKLYLVPSQNALVVRATPDQLMLIQKLLNDLDRPKPEVVVDIAILEVNRDKIRNLGITLPQSFGLTPTTATTNSSNNSGSSSGTNTGSSTTSNITLNDLKSFNATNFNVSVTGATLNALLNDTDTRVLQNPRVRATDGQRAQLKIGSKIPYATGSYNAGVSTGVANIGVQTQFNYVDIGVNIDMTPTVHYDHEVTLKMVMEVTTEAGQVTISGVTEPIIGQRHSEQVIQLKEGEPSILAGLLDQEESRTNSGTPGLAQIPLLKYIFGSQFHEDKRDEIVFLLIPHIVRESVLTDFNTRAIDTGTGQDITLRHIDDMAAVEPVAPRATAPTPPPTTAANAANAVIQQMSQQGRPAALAAAGAMMPSPTAAAPQAAGPPVTLAVVPPNSTQSVGSTFQVNVMLSGARDLTGVPLSVHYDPKVLSLVNISSGELLARDGQGVAMVRNDPSPGVIELDASRPPNAAGVNGQGTLCTLTFKANSAGDSALSLSEVGARTNGHGNLPAVGSQAVVHVK